MYLNAISAKIVLHVVSAVALTITSQPYSAKKQFFFFFGFQSYNFIQIKQYLNEVLSLDLKKTLVCFNWNFPV